MTVSLLLEALSAAAPPLQALPVQLALHSLAEPLVGKSPLLVPNPAPVQLAAERTLERWMLRRTR